MLKIYIRKSRKKVFSKYDIFYKKYKNVNIKIADFKDAQQLKIRKMNTFLKKLYYYDLDGELEIGRIPKLNLTKLNSYIQKNIVDYKHIYSPKHIKNKNKLNILAYIIPKKIANENKNIIIFHNKILVKTTYIKKFELNYPDYKSTGITYSMKFRISYKKILLNDSDLLRFKLLEL